MEAFVFVPPHYNLLVHQHPDILPDIPNNHQLRHWVQYQVQEMNLENLRNFYLATVQMLLLLISSWCQPQLVVLLVTDQCPHDRSGIRMLIGFLYSAFVEYKQRCCWPRYPASQRYLSMFYFL